MNVVISLCHFCEKHGPVVLFCTQIVDLHSSDTRDNSSNEDMSNENISWSVQMPHLRNETFKKSKCSKKCSNILQKECDVFKSCEACQSFPNSTSGLISSDSSSSYSYITQQHSDNKIVNSIIKQACVRSISCEHCPGQSGALFYGDDSGFNTLCYKFFLKDFHSRGFKRSYCINFTSQDKIYLLNSWRFLVKNLEIIVNKLKHDAENKFNAEHAEHGVLRCRSPTSSSTATSTSTSSSSSCLQLKVHNELTNSKQARSLVDMTDNQDIYKQLHMMFVWLLKSFNEKVIVLAMNKIENVEREGGDEKFIDMNRQEETEEGFIKLFCFKKSDTLTNLTKCVNKSDDDDDDEEEEEEHPMALFTHPRDLLKVLGLSMFSELLHHCLIGHQLVIRARDRPIIKSIIHCLVKFLPEKMIKINYHTTDYAQNSDHQFIGMPLLPLPPPSITPYALLDVSGIHTLKKISQLDKCSIAKYYESSKLQIEELMLRYYMLTTDKLQLPLKSPAILDSILKMLMNEFLDNSVVDLCLLSIKEDWLNKASMYQLHICTGEQKSKLDENRFFQIINVKEEDKTLLKYWAKAF